MSIEVRGIHKRFGPFTALEDVNLHVQTGELSGALEREWHALWVGNGPGGAHCYIQICLGHSGGLIGRRLLAASKWTSCYADVSAGQHQSRRDAPPQQPISGCP